MEKEKELKREWRPWLQDLLSGPGEASESSWGSEMSDLYDVPIAAVIPRGATRDSSGLCLDKGALSWMRWKHAKGGA